MANTLEIMTGINDSFAKIQLPKSARLYTEEKNRRATFKHWPFTSKNACNPDKLAEAGFYYIGTSKNEDIVCCFLCQKTLDSWDAEDDPWAEHLSHSTNCSFAKMHKPQNDQTLSEFLNFRTKALENVLDKEVEKRIEMLSEYVAAAKQVIRNL